MISAIVFRGASGFSWADATLPRAAHSYGAAYAGLPKGLRCGIQIFSGHLENVLCLTTFPGFFVTTVSYGPSASVAAPCGGCVERTILTVHLV